MLVPYRVLLPKRLLEQSADKHAFKSSVAKYMERYPHYHLIRIEGNFALCERLKTQEDINIG